MKLTDRIKSKLASINLVSVAFFALSIFSIAFAWFAYTNTVSTNFQAEVKTWKIRITNDNTEINNTLDINIGDLYPGMTNYTDSFTIQNQGQLDAQIDYDITYLRVFDTVVTTTKNLTFYELERNYPFKISITPGNRYLGTNSTTTLNVVCSWALNSGDDDFDTEYGNLAYSFAQSENQLHQQNSSYQIRPAIELKIEIKVSQYTDTPSSFSTDSWSAIQLAVERGQTSSYSVGNTKTITIGNTNYTVRLSNKNNTDSICTNSSKSQSACGFVIEFTSIYNKKKLRIIEESFKSWPDTELHGYANGEFFSSIPYDLRKYIATTRVISGHFINYTSNYTSYDKIYIPSLKEVSNSNDDDTAASLSRRLDYYQSNTSAAAKKKMYNGSYTAWWLRTYRSNSAFLSGVIKDNGIYDSNATPSFNGGFSPMFRIA